MQTTDGNGEISLPDLDPGTYLIKEIATDAAHVVNSTPQEIELGPGQEQTLVFLNQMKPGIHLVKLDSQTLAPLPNVRFSVKQVGGSFNQEYLTDGNGEIDLSSLTPGAYEVKELETPENYIMDSSVRVVQINPDENVSLVYTNTQKPALSVVKLDPQTGKHLAGATFRIAKVEDGTRYLDRVTDINGRILLENLDPGVYSVQELAAPGGYVTDSSEYHATLFPGQTSEVVVNNAKKPNLKIVKTDALTGEPVQGVTFTLKTGDGATLLTTATNVNGEILLEQLAPGLYEVTEQSAPDGYLPDAAPQKITLFPNRTGELHFKNYPKPTIMIQKTDSVTGAPVEGAKFHVVYGSSHTFSGETNDLGIYSTDANGHFIGCL